jgi:Ycf66 protein N-terminus
MPPSCFALVALLFKRSFRNFAVMLAYLLSVIVGTGSVALYLSAFLFPEIHRQKDIFWSGLGLFYALVLWVNGQSFSGGLLLGQTLSVVLLSWFVWETLMLRREIIPANQRTPIPPLPRSPWAQPELFDTPETDPDRSPASTNVDDNWSAASPAENQIDDDTQPWIEIRQDFPNVP